MESKHMIYEPQDVKFPCKVEFTFKETGKKEIVKIGSAFELQLFVFMADYLIDHGETIEKKKLPK